MKILHLKKIVASAFLIAVVFTSCKNKPDTENENTAPAVVSTEGDTVHVDTANVPLDTGKATKPIIRKNSEDGTNSGL